MSVAEKRGGRGGNRDFSCWYLLRNHLDMNCSPPNGNPYSSSFPKALLRGCRWEAASLSPSYPFPHLCSLIKTPADSKALHHPLTPIEFPVPHHWVYGPSLGLLMTWRRVTHLNMEICHRVHTLPYMAGLNGISAVFFDWWYHPSALQAFLDNVAFLTSIICLFKKPSPLNGSCEWQFSATQTPAASSIQSAAQIKGSTSCYKGSNWNCNKFSSGWPFFNVQNLQFCSGILKGTFTPAAVAGWGTCCAVHAMAGQDKLDELLQ